MSAYIIEGGHPLDGSVRIHGAKNSVLPILAACLLAPGECVIHNCPELSDVAASLDILRHLGCRAERQGDAVVVDASAPLDIQHEDGVWFVEGPWLQRLMGNVNFADYESRMWFDKTLRESGLFQQLESLGIQDGDTVSMYDFEFEYQR